MRSRLFTPALLAALLLTGCSQESGSKRSLVKPVEIRKTAPDFALKDSNGNSVKLSDYRGKVVLLNFWATWCGPCKIEIPWFVEFQNEYKSRDFEVLGLSMDDDGWDAVKPYLAHSKINYRVMIANDRITQLYGGVDALPTSFVLDREGRIAAIHVGLAGKNEYRNEILALLGPGPASTVTQAAVTQLTPHAGHTQRGQR